MTQHLPKALALTLLAASLAACTNVVSSNPARTATEELLISTAADEVSREIEPSGSRPEL